MSCRRREDWSWNVSSSIEDDDGVVDGGVGDDVDIAEKGDGAVEGDIGDDTGEVDGDRTIPMSTYLTSKSRLESPR